ncbi:MAG: hypothetical protein ACRDMW_07935 [Gaiellaceae bacterium]
MRFRLLLPAIAFVAALAFPASGSANDLPNGSFENRLQSWASMGSALASRAGGVHGSRYARAAIRRGTAFGLFTTPSLDLDAGQSVSARASIRAPRGKQVCVRIRERRAGKLVAQAVRCVASTGAWQRPPALGYTVRHGDSTLALAVFERRTRTRNWIDVDNVVLNAVPLGTPPAGTVIVTNRPWNCTGALTAFGTLPIKVVSTIANASANDNDNAVSLRGCSGDGDPATIDLILDIRGNRGAIGTSYDAVRIGQNAHDLVVTGNAECGARSSDPSIHQDIVQALSGSNITFVDFTSGDPFTGRWTCWGAGGGWYITWANAGIPTDLICLRCILATYNQNLRIGESVRSGARDSVFGYSRSYGIFVESGAQSPVNVNNRVIRY